MRCVGLRRAKAPPITLQLRGYRDATFSKKPLPVGKSINFRSKQPVCLLMSQNVVASLPKCLRIDPATERNSSSASSLLQCNCLSPAAAEPIPLFFSLSPVKLYAVPRQRALERNRNVRRQRTEHLDVFGGKLLSLQLWR